MSANKDGRRVKQYDLSSLLPLPESLLPGHSKPSVPIDLHSASRRPLILGGDGGATKTTAALFDVNAQAAYLAHAGPSNPHSSSFSQADESICDSINMVLEIAGASANDVLVAILGVASIDTDEDRMRIEEGARSALPKTLLYVVNDVVAAWASGTLGEPGIALISGTGSNCFGVDGVGATWRSGGWGHILGDEGAGYWIGLQALRAAVAFRDGRGAPTVVIPKMLSRYNLDKIEDLHKFVYESFDKAAIAALTPDVVDAALIGDAVALGILRQAGGDLASHVIAVASKLTFEDGFPVVMVGSTFRAGRLLLDPLSEKLFRHTLRAQLVVPKLPPVGGSIWLGARVLGIEKLISFDALVAALDGQI